MARASSWHGDRLDEPIDLRAATDGAAYSAEEVADLTDEELDRIEAHLTAHTMTHPITAMPLGPSGSDRAFLNRGEIAPVGCLKRPQVVASVDRSAIVVAAFRSSRRGCVLEPLLEQAEEGSGSRRTNLRSAAHGCLDGHLL
jgi:hypothetical protein